MDASEFLSTRRSGNTFGSNDMGGGDRKGHMVIQQPTAKLPGTDPLITPSALSRLDGSVILRKSGLLFARGVAFDRWEVIGQQLLSVTDSTSWWLADWIAYGERIYQDRYREAIQSTSLSYQTLRNYVWIARRFPLSRRHDNLSFGHHAEVAALDPPEQDYWLRKAEEREWSRNQLRNEVRNSLRLREADGAPNTAARGEGAEGPEHTNALSQDSSAHNGAKMLSLQLTIHQLTQFTMAAHNQKKPLEEWALHALERMAHDEGFPDEAGAGERALVTGRFA